MPWASIRLPSSPQGQVPATGVSPAAEHRQEYPRQPTPPCSASSPGLPVPPADGQPCPRLQRLLPGASLRGPAQQASHFRGAVSSFRASPLYSRVSPGTRTANPRIPGHSRGSFADARSCTDSGPALGGRRALSGPGPVWCGQDPGRPPWAAADTYWTPGGCISGMSAAPS